MRKVGVTQRGITAASRWKQRGDRAANDPHSDHSVRGDRFHEEPASSVEFDNPALIIIQPDLQG